MVNRPNQSYQHGATASLVFTGKNEKQVVLHKTSSFMSGFLYFLRCSCCFIIKFILGFQKQHIIGMLIAQWWSLVLQVLGSIHICDRESILF